MTSSMRRAARVTFLVAFFGSTRLAPSNARNLKNQIELSEIGKKKTQFKRTCPRIEKKNGWEIICILLSWHILAFQIIKHFFFFLFL